MMKFYVYLLTCEANTYYVGKGHGRRMAESMREHGALSGRKVNFTDDEDFAYYLERLLISALQKRGFTLRNKFVFGDMSNGWTSSRHPEDVKRKIGEKSRGRKIGPPSVETLEKIRSSNVSTYSSGSLKHSKAVTKSEYREKQRLKSAGRASSTKGKKIHTEEFKQRMRERMMGNSHNART